MAAAAYFGEEGQARPSRPVRSLLFGLLHRCLVAEDGLQLVAHDGRHEQAEQAALHHQND